VTLARRSLLALMGTGLGSTVVLAACGRQGGGKQAAVKGPTIAMWQMVDSQRPNEVRRGFIAALAKAGYTEGKTVNFVEKDAAGRGARSGAPGVGGVGEDHGDLAGDLLHRRLQRWRADGEDHGGGLAGELLHHQCGVGNLAGGVLLDEVEGLALGVAGLGQGFDEAAPHLIGGLGIHHLQHGNGGALDRGLIAAPLAPAGGEHHRAAKARAHQGQKAAAVKGHENGVRLSW